MTRRKDNPMTGPYLDAELVKLQQQLSSLKIVEKRCKKAEEALYESEQKLTQLLNAIPYGVFIVDEKGTPQFANLAAREIDRKSVV